MTLRIRAPLEKQTQAGITRLLRQLGFAVYDLSQPRATKQTAGLPDLIAFGRRKTLFVEVKRKPREPTDAQLEFGACVADAEGTWVVWYSTREAGEWLRDHGLAGVR